MPSFGPASMERLETCHADLQRLCFRVIEFYDFSVLEGNRSLERQKELFDAGQSQIDGIAQIGMHNHYPSLAVDLMPWPPLLNGRDVWNDKFRWHYFAGLVMGTAREMGIDLRWGGDWNGDFSNADQKFHDLPHFERLA